jgi:hypothetical protein
MIDVNYLAVAVAAVAALIVSTAWYMAFAQRMATLNDAYADQARTPPWKILVELVRNLVVASVLAGLASLLEIEELTGAALLGLSTWVGFPVVLLTGSVIWERVPWKLAAIHAGDWLLKLLIISVIVSLWR